MAGDIVGLADAIEALRAALTEAVGKSKDEAMRFQIEPIELTLQAVVTKDANGKIGWGALGIGGGYQSASTQTLTLKLRPLWKAEDGSMIADFTIADQSLLPQHFGPKRATETAPSNDG